MRIYQATVASDPRRETKVWDGKEVDTVSVNIKMDDSDAPKTNDRGYAWVNSSNPNSENGRYLLGLHQGDRLSVAYSERGGKGFYNPVVSESPSANGSAPDVKTPKQNSTVPPRSNTYNLLSDADQLSFGQLVNEGLTLFKTTWQQTLAEFPSEAELTCEDIYKIAYTAFAYAERKFTPGMSITRIVPRYQTFLDRVGKPESLQEILQAIAGVVGTSPERAQNIIKKFMSSDDLMIDGDKSKWIDAFEIVDRFVQKTANGTASGLAIEQVATELGLPTPDLI